MNLIYITTADGDEFAYETDIAGNLLPLNVLDRFIPTKR